jgi:transcription elongation factor Elf1
MEDLYYVDVVNDVERKQSSLDENVCWLNCPDCGASSFTDVAVNTKTGNIYGSCTNCKEGTEVRLNP